MPPIRTSLAAWIVFLLIGGSILLPLAACGKVGSPALPPGVKATYPRTYPSDDTK